MCCRVSNASKCMTKNDDEYFLHSGRQHMLHRTNIQEIKDSFHIGHVQKQKKIHQNRNEKRKKS